MNKMYQYLKEHNYISSDENKDPFKQQELSKERAEAIAYKYTSLLEEIEEKNKKNEEAINKAKRKLTSMFDNGEDEKILDDLLELCNILGVE